MRTIIFLLNLLILTSAHAAIVNSMLINGADYKLLHIVSKNNTGYVYAENNQHQKILIYKSPHPYSPHSVFSINQLENTEILDIIFECDTSFCSRFLNRQTNQLSDIYYYALDYDAKKDVIAYYLKDKNMLVISRVFKTCKKPLTYLTKLEEDSEFGIKTKFLPSGELQLDYTTPDGKDVIKIIHPNYKKLLSGCGGVN
ncbi:MAG: hypothetical protein JSR33_04210 [Proteobacteria bacterium]|nr:hypothetical protein [Pseudomonadota bacterium]